MAKTGATGRSGYIGVHARTGRCDFEFNDRSLPFSIKKTYRGHEGGETAAITYDLLALVYRAGATDELPTLNFTTSSYCADTGAGKLKEFYTAAQSAAAAQQHWPRPPCSSFTKLISIINTAGDGQSHLGVAPPTALSAATVPESLACASAATRSSTRRSAH